MKINNYIAMVILLLVIILFLFLFSVPAAFAGNEDGKLTSGGKLLITDFDIKIDGLTSRNIEYGDTLSRKANPSSKIEFDLQLKNNHTDLSMNDIEIIVQIEELDLEKTLTDSSVSSNNDERFKTEMTLPSDVEEQDYEVFVEASGELNNTIHRVEFVFDIEVEFPDSSTSSSSSVSSNSILYQLNDSLTKLNTDIKYFPLYTQCYSDLEANKKDSDVKTSKIAELETNKVDYETCSKTLTDAQTQVYDLNSRLSISEQSLTTCSQDLDKSNKNGMLYGVLGALFIGAIWAYQNRKQTPFTKKAKIARS